MSFLIVLVALLLTHTITWWPFQRFEYFAAQGIFYIQKILPEKQQGLLLLLMCVCIPVVTLGIIAILLQSLHLSLVMWVGFTLLLAWLLRLDALSGRIQSLQTVSNEVDLSFEQSKLDPLIRVLRTRSKSDFDLNHQGIILARHALIYSWFCHIFITLFAFVVSGIYGALFIAMLFTLHRHTGEQSGLLDILEWLPARLLALSFLFIGNFNKGFPVWIESLTNPLMAADQVLGKVADSACELSPNPNQELEDLLANLQAVDQLITRVGFLWLLLLGSFVLIRML